LFGESGKKEKNARTKRKKLGQGGDFSKKGGGGGGAKGTGKTKGLKNYKPFGGRE